MQHFERTVPRSARRMPKRESNPPVTPYKPKHNYAPTFQREATPVTVPPVRTGAEAFYPVTDPVLAFFSAPITRARWLPVPGRDAIATLGSGDAHQNFLAFCAVSAESNVEVVQAREIPHDGKVRGLAISQSTDTMYVGSSTGCVKRLSYCNWESDHLSHVVDLAKEADRSEGIAGVAAVSGMVVAAGDHGSLCGADFETCTAWVRQFDEVGFKDIVAVDENGSEVVTAGCDVTIWDVRTGSRCGLVHPAGGVATCVAGDMSMPQFIMAGTRDGEVCVWDRRAEAQPISRVMLHEGPVWDVRVVSGRSGVLTCCGEDGMVWVVDFAKAASRGGLGSAEQVWSERGEYWRAAVEQSDVRRVVGADSVLAINSMDVHDEADLFVYGSDSGSAGFGRLFG